MIYVASEDQYAGVLTKALERKKFERHLNFVMNID